MTLLYFIRHGQASLASDNYDELSEIGIRQAEIMGDFLAQLGMRFDALYCGYMSRQTDTARVVLSRMFDDAAAPGMQSAPEFDEYDAHGILRSQLADVVKEDPTLGPDVPKVFTDGKSLERVFLAAMLRWTSGRFKAPGMETWEEFNDRVRRGIFRIAAENPRGRTVAVFTSGGAISSAMQIALGLSDETVMRLVLRIRNASISVFQYDGRRLSLLSFNSVAHLELRNNPELITFR